jgi:sugar phosphate permease
MVTWYEIGTLIGGSALGLLSDLLGGKRPPVAIFAIIVAGTISFYITFNF